MTKVGVLNYYCRGNADEIAQGRQSEEQKTRLLTNGGGGRLTRGRHLNKIS